MATYWHVIFFSLIGGVFSLIGGLLLLSRQKTAEGLAKYATPFAAGALLAAVFLDLLTDGLEESSAETVMWSALVGIAIFFFLERFLRWFHHHHAHEGEKHDHRTGMIIIGDTLHNALDGIAIAASFLISVPTGIVTTIAVAAHEIPQEVGDFGLLLSRGMRRRNVLLVNFISALATVILAVVTFALGSADKLPIGVLIGVSAGFLLYIAMSDLIPSIHESSPKKKLFDWRPVLFILGIFTVAVAIQLAHNYIDTDHAHTEEHSISDTEHEHSDEMHE